MYQLNKRKNIMSKVTSDFGELLDHIESEQARLSKIGKFGQVEILDTDSEKSVLLTLPYEGDLVSYLEKSFNMQEISEEEQDQHQNPWTGFTESADEKDEDELEIITDPKGALVDEAVRHQDLRLGKFEISSPSDIERFGALSRKIVDHHCEEAERLRQQLLSQIIDKENGLIQTELNNVQEKLDQKQKIYDKLMSAVTTASDIDEVVIIANELVELQLIYDKVAARRG